MKNSRDLRPRRQPRARRLSGESGRPERTALSTEPKARGQVPLRRGGRIDYRAVVVLVVFAALFTTLAVRAFTQASATWDEPIHITAGYAALARHDFRVDPSHPPLLRMWAALPALFMGGVSMDAVPADGVPQLQWLQDAYGFAHRFMYVENDADRLLYAGRFMVVLLGVLLGFLVFLWTYEWLGFAPAAIALAFFTFEPNLLAHASLVTTDLGVTCFMFGAVYFTWRTCRRFAPINVAGLAMFVALAILSKFSAVLLAPVIAVLLAVAVMRRQEWTPRRALAVLCLLAAVSFGAIWAGYGFRYLPTSSEAGRLSLHETGMAADAPAMAAVVKWVDTNRILPNAYVQGFFYTYASVQRMPAFLAGGYSEHGWWYYFPAAFLMKTPTALVILVGAGLVAFAWRRGAQRTDGALFVLVPAAVYLGVAMWSSVNIGLRHILPVYPFLMLIAAVGAREMLRMPRPGRVAAVAAATLLWTGEYAAAYPHPLTFFNYPSGGPENGYRHLSDSNLGWGQSLKPLKSWMDRNRVTHVNLAYFGQADPAYYGIDCTHLPGAPTFATDAIARPRVPGYVAISPTTLMGVYAPASWRLFYAPFRDLEPVVVIGHSMRVYWVDEWPEAIGAHAGGAGPDAHRALADALLLGYQWPERALVHYREYLQARPDDADALVNYGMALVAVNRAEEGVASFHRAVAANGEHGMARLMLGKALFVGRDLRGAAAQAERAVALIPRNPETHYLLGRVHAVEGRFEEASRDFRRVIDIEPRHVEAQDYLRRLQDAMHPRAPTRTGMAP